MPFQILGFVLLADAIFHHTRAIVIGGNGFVTQHVLNAGAVHLDLGVLGTFPLGALIQLCTCIGLHKPGLGQAG